SCWSAVSDIAVWTSRNTVAARWEDRTGRSVRAARGGRAHGTGTRRCAAVPAGPGSKGDRAMQSQHSPQTVGQAGEFAVIAAAVAATDGGPDPRVVVDTGDDAAVLRAGDGTVTVCTDMLVEGRHFRLDWSAPADVGHKAIAQNAADIAAMGAVPTGFTVALACPAETDVRVAVEIQRGLAAGAAAAGARVVGGDLVQAGQIVVSVTALGDLQGRAPLTRAGARPGATVALAGRLGHGAAGLAALAAGHRGPETAAVRAAHLRPAPPYAAGPAAARAGAQALID